MYFKPKLFNLKEKISLIVLSNFISEHKLSKSDSILLYKDDLDEIALEYRETFKERFNHVWQTVFLREDFTGRVRANSIGVARNSNAGRDQNNEVVCVDVNIDRFAKHHFVPNESYKFETIHRCKFCSNIVDIDGLEFLPETADFKTLIYEKYYDSIDLVDVICLKCEEIERQEQMDEEFN